MEGYLFPATYPFYEEKPTLNTIVGEMLEATAANVLPHLNYLGEQEKSVHWLLTFASLVEKEATAQSERDTIASVFYNRMKLKPDNAASNGSYCRLCTSGTSDRLLCIRT